MALTITDQIMRSTDTRHNAIRLWSEDNPDANVWSVSWLPKQRLDHDQAVTAMTIAEIVCQVPAEGDAAAYFAPWLPQLEGWAAELGMTAPAVIAQASEPPE